MFRQAEEIAALPGQLFEQAEKQNANLHKLPVPVIAGLL
jgi:hypothetical protein